MSLGLWEKETFVKSFAEVYLNRILVTGGLVEVCRLEVCCLDNI